MLKNIHSRWCTAPHCPCWAHRPSQDTLWKGPNSTKGDSPKCHKTSLKINSFCCLGIENCICSTSDHFSCSHPQYMMPCRLNPLLPSAKPVLVGSRTPKSRAQGSKNGAKAKERLSSSGTSSLHFPTQASSFLKS